MTYDVGHLVVASIVHTLHRVQDATLYGFQSVFNMWYGTFQNYIGSIVQEPVLVHAAQVMHRSSIKTIYGLVVRVPSTFCRLFLLF